MDTVTDIIERLGGTSAVASALALTPSTVSSWKTSGRVPAWRQPALIELAKERSVQLSDADFRSVRRSGSATKAEQAAA